MPPHKMQSNKLEKRTQKLWSKLGAIISLLFALVCFTGVVQSVLLLGLSNQPQPTAFRNLIISSVSLLISFVGFIFFALAFRRATRNPLQYNRKQ
jgi:TRAP-type C4-dicarboxylate transport system permease small subunit